MNHSCKENCAGSRGPPSKSWNLGVVLGAPNTIAKECFLTLEGHPHRMTDVSLKISVELMDSGAWIEVPVPPHKSPLRALVFSFVKWGQMRGWCEDEESRVRGSVTQGEGKLVWTEPGARAWGWACSIAPHFRLGGPGSLPQLVGLLERPEGSQPPKQRRAQHAAGPQCQPGASLPILRW